MNLFEEKIPRSKSTVERLAGDANRRIRKVARILQFAFIGVATVSGLIAGAASASRADNDWGDASAAVMLIVLIGGVLPGWLVAKMILNDADVTNELVRCGTAYSGTLINHTVYPPEVNVAWEENGREQRAFVTLGETFESPDPSDIVILARPGQNSVGVVFGRQGLFVGLRK